MSVKLTIVERAMLANQYRILAKLNEDEDYNVYAEIVEEGYEHLYHDLFQNFNNEGLPEEISIEVYNIFDMFTKIGYAIDELSPEEKEQLDLRRLEFDGFDANQGQHYHYAKFVTEKRNIYEWMKPVQNSHDGTSILRYRNMWEVYSSFENPSRGLKFDQLKQLADAAY